MNKMAITMWTHTHAREVPPVASSCMLEAVIKTVVTSNSQPHSLNLSLRFI